MFVYFPVVLLLLLLFIIIAKAKFFNAPDIIDTTKKIYIEKKHDPQSQGETKNLYFMYLFLYIFIYF